MNIQGFYNEIDFLNTLNKKHIYELNKELQKMLQKIYKGKLKEKDYIKCYKSFKTDKTDIIINMNNIQKNISIKSDKNNSIHLEPIDQFKNFLKINKIPKELIDIYTNYHYATDENGNRCNAKKYQENHQKEIEKFNDAVNTETILEKAIHRFIFKGTHKYNNEVDAIIYGNINDFICLTREEVTEYLLKQENKFNSIHFSSLTLQPWTRNLNNNPKYEERRHYIQVKWYRMEKLKEKKLNKDV